jgi:hypothetical protein
MHAPTYSAVGPSVAIANARKRVVKSMWRRREFFICRHRKGDITWAAFERRNPTADVRQHQRQAVHELSGGPPGEAPLPGL